MAKKTNYLTELIERHERWKAEGGERAEEEDRHHQPPEPYVFLQLWFCHARVCSLPTPSFSAPGEPDDLWDFGTVRNAATVGRGHANPVQVSGPPLTWENNGTTRSDDSGSSGGSAYSRRDVSHLSNTSAASSVTAKGELPPIPQVAPGTPTPKKFDQQATIRTGGGLSREPSDEYDDDYEDPVTDPRAQNVPVDDELPDTTMLDSVVLPAIASVSYAFCVLRSLTETDKVALPRPFPIHFIYLYQLFPRVSTQEARVALSALQRAFTDAERIIPGVTLELVNEIVDSVEHVEDER